jgi:hypothetical protein
MSIARSCALPSGKGFRSPKYNIYLVETDSRLYRRKSSPTITAVCDGNYTLLDGGL